MKLRNKNVLIFGGGSGIWKAIAIRFISAGAKVFITGRTEDKLKTVADNAILQNHAVSSENISESIKIKTENGFYLKANA